MRLNRDPGVVAGIEHEQVLPAVVVMAPRYTNPDVRSSSAAKCQAATQNCHAGLPSMIVMPVGEEVATARVSLKPAA
jgi:hypothetical protein